MKLLIFGLVFSVSLCFGTNVVVTIKKRKSCWADQCYSTCANVCFFGVSSVRLHGAFGALSTTWAPTTTKMMKITKMIRKEKGERKRLVRKCEEKQTTRLVAVNVEEWEKKTAADKPALLLLLLKLSNGQLMVNVNGSDGSDGSSSSSSCNSRNSGHSNRSNLIDAGESRRGKGRAEKE